MELRAASNWAKWTGLAERSAIKPNLASEGMPVDEALAAAEVLADVPYVGVVDVVSGLHGAATEAPAKRATIEMALVYILTYGIGVPVVRGVEVLCRTKSKLKY